MGTSGSVRRNPGPLGLALVLVCPDLSVEGGLATLVIVAVPGLEGLIVFSPERGLAHYFWHAVACASQRALPAPGQSVTPGNEYRDRTKASGDPADPPRFRLFWEPLDELADGLVH